MLHKELHSKVVEHYQGPDVVNRSVFCISVAQLQREERGEPPTEDVLACGRWKKPDTLQDAKFDFLVTDACIYSTKDPSKYHRIGRYPGPNINGPFSLKLYIYIIDILIKSIRFCISMGFFPFLFLEFMIDTGSDVTTIRQEVLNELGLEILGRIHSKGVHGSKTTNLYKAKLLIGNQEMEIEVSPVLSHILNLDPRLIPDFIKYNIHKKEAFYDLF